MIDGELFAFVDVFKNLLRVFPKRLEEHEGAQIQRDYFKALRRFTIHQVTAGADAWMQRGRYFPKPAEWIDAIPRRASAPEIPELSVAQASEWLAAERRGYEGDPCSCIDCREAIVDDKSTRFVPEFDDLGNDLRVKIGERIVTRGHWAHGRELRRWYQARADFWESCHARGLTTLAKELTKSGA